MKNDWNEFFKGLRQQGVGLLLPAAGVTPDYSAKSIEQMEENINRMFPRGHEPMPTTVLTFGFYLGETLVRNLPGAEWKDLDSKHFEDISIECEVPDGGTAKFYPFRRVLKFWADRTDGLVVFYNMIALMAMGGLNAKKMKEGQWTTFPDGSAFRVQTKMTEEEYTNKYGK